MLVMISNTNDVVGINVPCYACDNHHENQKSDNVGCPSSALIAGLG
jgi:hypothetical protein